MDWERQRLYDDRIQRRITEGDFRGALETLVEGYQHVLVGFCINMVADAEHGEEIAQEVFLAAYNAMPRFRWQASVRTWLFAIARKQCLKARRNRSRRRRIEYTEQHAIAARAHRGPSMPPGEDPEIRLSLVKQVLGRLDKAERGVLLMRYDTGLSVADMAHILGISAASVRRRLVRALEHLREVMGDDA